MHVVMDGDGMDVELDALQCMWMAEDVWNTICMAASPLQPRLRRRSLAFAVAASPSPSQPRLRCRSLALAAAASPLPLQPRLRRRSLAFAVAT